MESCRRRWPFVLSFFHFPECLQDSPRPEHVSVPDSFLWVCNTPFCFDKYRLMNLWTISPHPCFELLLIIVLNTVVHTFLHGHIFHFSCVPTWEWNCWVTWELCFTFWGTSRLFSGVAMPFYSPTCSARGFQSLCPGQHLPLSLNRAVRGDVKWDFLVILICISLMANLPLITIIEIAT